MKELKFRAWSKKHNSYLKFRGIQYDDDKIAGVFVVYGTIAGIPNTICLEPEDVIIEQYTGLKDKNGDKEIYEYDIIDGEGNIIGNYHETPELLKDRTNLLIQGFGTKTWLATYQEAVERGCHNT